MNSQQRTILALYAHPDDEILSPGGTLAHYAQQGASVALAVATRGEAGEIQRPGTATRATLPDVRERETRCSADALGISDLTFLGYRDSGMAGTADNDHPDAFANAPADDVVGCLVATIRRLRPHVIVTFGPYGGYGHPDHVAIHRHAVAAFDAAGDPGRFPEQGNPWRPRRLFYSILPTALFRRIKERVAARGGDISGFDEMIERRRQTQDDWPDAYINAVVDVSDAIEAKWAAWNCHRTQFGPNSRFRRLPAHEMKELLSTEYFILGRPTPPPGLHLTGLFQPLREEHGDPQR